jgi:hypothetical protein
MTTRAAKIGVAMVFLAASATAEGEDGGDEASIHVAWLDVGGVVDEIAEMAQAECRSVMRRAGRDVVWSQAVDGESGRRDEIRVILVDRVLVDPEEPRYILGATPPGPRTHPVAWIHLGSVQATIGIPPGLPTSYLTQRGRRALALALGRVVAHELVHVLAPGLEHGDGLMSWALTPDELTTGRLSLAHDHVEALERPPQGPPPAGVDLLASQALEALTDGSPTALMGSP